MPHAVAPPDGCASTATPTKPTPTPTSAGQRSRSRAASRSTTTQSGTEAMISDASPVGTFRSAKKSTAFAPGSSAPITMHETSARLEIRSEPPRRRTMPGHQRAGGDEARRRGEERRDRLAGDCDPEVGRSPDHVDRDQRGPDLAVLRHELPNEREACADSQQRDPDQPAAARCRSGRRRRGRTGRSAAPITSWPAIRIPIVAVAPIRGWANVIVKTTVRPIRPPSHIQAGERNAPPSPPKPARATSEDREREDELDAGREGQRLDHADAAAEPSHHRDLNRAREPGEDRQCDCRRGHAAFVSFCQRLKLLPSVSLHAANQPCVGTGCLSSAEPPSSRTFATEASMSSVSRVDDQARSRRSRTA